MAITRADGVGFGRSTGLSNVERSALSVASNSRIMAAKAAVAREAVPPVPKANTAQTAPLRALPANPAPMEQCTASAPPAPSTRELALMAQAVYSTSPALPEGWSVATPADLAEIGLRPDMLTSPSSDFRAAVYVTEVCGQKSYTVAFKGTEFSSLSDWKANAGQAFGRETDHYNRALEIGRSLVVPEGARVSITGHSLGGGLASAASIAAELDATTFNAAGLSDETIAAAEQIAGADGRIDTPDINAYYVRGEILSFLQDGGERLISPFLDLPEAVGTRIQLDPQRPEGMHWWENTSVAKHQMDYVLSSLPQ